jgi:hypothetical protein
MLTNQHPWMRTPSEEEEDESVPIHSNPSGAVPIRRFAAKSFLSLLAEEESSRVVFFTGDSPVLGPHKVNSLHVYQSNYSLKGMRHGKKNKRKKKPSHEPKN